MTTPAISVPTTAPTFDRLRTPLLVAIAVAAVLAAALMIGLPGDETAPAASSDAVREWTRAELIDHLARVNGVAPSAAATGTAAATTSSGTTADVGRDATLEELYRINGVFPAQPAVPSGVR